MTGDLARAWDEGYHAGDTDAQRVRDARDWNGRELTEEELTVNPYSAARDAQAAARAEREERRAAPGVTSAVETFFDQAEFYLSTGRGRPSDERHRAGAEKLVARVPAVKLAERALANLEYMVWRSEEQRRTVHSLSSKLSELEASSLVNASDGALLSELARRLSSRVPPGDPRKG